MRAQITFKIKVSTFIFVSILTLVYMEFPHVSLYTYAFFVCAQIAFEIKLLTIICVSILTIFHFHMQAFVQYIMPPPLYGLYRGAGMWFVFVTYRI